MSVREPSMRSWWRSAGAAAGKYSVSQWRLVVGALLDTRCSEHSNSLELKVNCADEP